jgi:hypothetical protein
MQALFLCLLLQTNKPNASFVSLLIATNQQTQCKLCFFAYCYKPTNPVQDLFLCLLLQTNKPSASFVSLLTATNVNYKPNFCFI